MNLFSFFTRRPKYRALDSEEYANFVQNIEKFDIQLESIGDENLKYKSSKLKQRCEKLVKQINRDTDAEVKVSRINRVLDIVIQILEKYRNIISSNMNYPGIESIYEKIDNLIDKVNTEFTDYHRKSLAGEEFDININIKLLDQLLENL